MKNPLTEPAWLRPWYWRPLFHLLELGVLWAPISRLRHWANRTQQILVDHYGPFAHGRGWYCTIHRAEGEH
jgi:hypothetical protein